MELLKKKGTFMKYTSLVLIGMTALIWHLNATALNDSAVKVKWGYEGKEGPAHWGDLNRDFSLCVEGKEQSPINITMPFQKDKTALFIYYKPAPLVIVKDGDTSLLIEHQQTIINDGHTIQLNFPKQFSPEYIKLDSTKYRLVQFHFHTPSENHLKGKRFPMELHFVHQNEDKLVVIGVFVASGKENSVLEKIIKNLPKEEGKAEVITKERINPFDLLPHRREYYSFNGSLTTPPCSEGVRWIVMQEPITASKAQMAALKKAIKGGVNARPIQVLNERRIGKT